MIEVEKKFILTPEQEDKLIEGAEFLGEKKFTDIYYDDDDFSLTSSDIWFRERDGTYELKLPMNESLEQRASDQYRELDTEKDIQAYFNAHTPIQKILEEKNYKPFCTITTTRKKYKKEGFGIDVDTMDFGYNLVEIEYMTNDESKVKEATQNIIAFAKKHGIDTSKIVRGKVVEYLDRKNQKHFQALLKAEVFK